MDEMEKPYTGDPLGEQKMSLHRRAQQLMDEIHDAIDRGETITMTRVIVDGEVKAVFTGWKFGVEVEDDDGGYEDHVVDEET